MSRVTNVILIGSIDTLYSRLDEINAILTAQETVGLQMPFTRQEIPTAGSRYLEVDVLVGAINYLDLKKFIASLKDLYKDIDEADVVQLVYSDQHDFGCGMLTIAGTPDIWPVE